MLVRRRTLAYGYIWMLAATACHSAQVPPAPKTVTLVPRALQASQPRLVELGDGTVVLLWTGADHQTWAQRASFRAGLIGPTARVGRVGSSEESFARDPLAVPLADGDLALVGLLRDGRLTFARGSHIAERRIAPRVLLPAPEQPVVGVAAAATPTGFAVAQLLAASNALEGTMEVAVHWFDPHAKPARPSERWSAERGFAARMIVCDGVLHLAWRTRGGVVSTVIESATRGSEQRFAAPAPMLAAFGPLACAGKDARLFASWFKPGPLLEVAPEIGVVTSSANATAGSRWTRIELPGSPQSTLTSDQSLAAYASKGAARLVLSRNGHPTSVRLDLESLSILPDKLELGPGACMPDPSGARAICGDARPERTSPACRATASRLVVTLHGMDAREGAPSTANSADEFWRTGEVESQDVAASAELDASADRLVCGAREWTSLVEALQTRCESAKASADWSTLRPVYCDANLPTSMLYQMIQCTDRPSACRKTPTDYVPSVSRSEFAAGNVELTYARCSIFFRRESSRWVVSYLECAGD